jgi:serine/threonine-protein kinase HipA
MIRLVVWVTLASGEHERCGEMVCSDPDDRGRIGGAFRYTAGWIKHRSGFSLDPIELPLSEGEFACDRLQGVFRVFEDSLPDDWGRRLLIRKALLGRDRQTEPNLLAALNGHALGALSYYPEAFEPRHPSCASVIELENLVEAAQKYECGYELDDAELQMLFAAASSPGGARPKALVRTEDGEQWVAKFPSAKDYMAMVPLEAATLALAQKAGLNVPQFRIERCGRHTVLLVKRFDLSDHGGRRHMISFQTLMQAQGYYALGYMDLFEMLRRVTDRPAIDIAAFYRQMVFNALIGNTDDHLKNFCLLHDDIGFHLSPAYDLLPDTAGRREHVLHFSASFLFPGIEQLILLGKRAQLSRPERIVEEVRSTVAAWESEFERWNVPEDDIRRLFSGIDGRLKG